MGKGNNGKKRKTVKEGEGKDRAEFTCTHVGEENVNWNAHATKTDKEKKSPLDEEVLVANPWWQSKHSRRDGRDGRKSLSTEEKKKLCFDTPFRGSPVYS